jgi:hypothetical protein
MRYRIAYLFCKESKMIERKTEGSHVVMSNGKGTVVAGFVIGYKNNEMIVDIGNNGFVSLDETWSEVK